MTCCFDVFQLGFHANQSTETALNKVFNNIRRDSDSRRTTVLLLLDLSAAFYTVDHSILLERPENLVGLSVYTLEWFKSYLEDRDFYVSAGNFKLICRVPQSSVLGFPPIQYLHAPPNSDFNTKQHVTITMQKTHSWVLECTTWLWSYQLQNKCIEEINAWMCQNDLQLIQN